MDEKNIPIIEVMMEVVKISVLLTSGVDKIFIYTNFPCPFIKESGVSQSLCLSFDATVGTGANYVLETFGIEPEVIKGSKDEKVSLPYNADVWEPVKSTNISHVGTRGDELLIRFTNGITYSYPGAAVNYSTLMASESKGKAFHKLRPLLNEFKKISNSDK